jgi:alanine dehydrogenase
MSARTTLLLSRRDVASLLTLDECIAEVERVFRLHGEGKVGRPEVLGVHVDGGGFHVKAAVMERSRRYFATKLNANFPENRRKFELPTIQGVIILCDAECGFPLAVMDSIEITIQRTGAATAIAARHLARPDSHVATICGCGNQGRVQLAALARVLPIRHVFAFDQDRPQACGLIEKAERMNIVAEAASDLATAARQSDVVVTCTPSTRFFLQRDHVKQGTFIAAVGADNPEKQELDPVLFADSKVVADSVEQCSRIGDLHHAIERGVVSRSNVWAELGELVAKRKPGRTSDQEITIFDSTGTALQDVATAALTYDRALAARLGTTFEFADTPA